MKPLGTVTDDLTIGNITKAMIFHSGEPFATSTQISRYFGIRHDNLLRKIESFYSFDQLIGSSKLRSQTRTIRGKEYPYYELDADAFAFTCLSLTGKKAEAFKWVFIEAFKKATLEAVTAKVSAQTNLANEKFFALREEGKKKHISFTDAIKALCQYAEEERGYSYDGKCPYFALFHKLVYKTLDIKVSKAHKPNRDTLSPDILEWIERLETYLVNEILGMVEFNIPYRSIYMNCKKSLKKKKDEVQESQY